MRSWSSSISQLSTALGAPSRTFAFVAKRRPILARVIARRRLAFVLLAALAFGVLIAVVKGQDPGWRQTFGNLSAPWTLAPFLAGTCCGRAWPAALAGLAATFAAFLGFHAAEAAVLDLGPHPWYTDLELNLGSGHVYWKLGLLSGPVFGVLGWSWAARRLPLAPLALGLAFATEPLIVWFLGQARIWGNGLDHHWIFIAEVSCGVAVAGLMLARRSAPGARLS